MDDSTGIETFPAPPGCTRVRFVTDEVVSICPLTQAPDISSLVIDYVPDGACIETRSLKRYLSSFRDRHIYAESLAAEIAEEIQRATASRGVRVVVTQHVRGGIVTECTSEIGDVPPLASPRPSY